MAQDATIMNGGESPLASKVKSAQTGSAGEQAAPEASAAVQTSWDMQTGAGVMDGGPAPGAKGASQETLPAAPADSSGVAGTGGMVHSK